MREFEFYNSHGFPDNLQSKFKYDLFKKWLDGGDLVFPWNYSFDGWPERHTFSAILEKLDKRFGETPHEYRITGKGENINITRYYVNEEKHSIVQVNLSCTNSNRRGCQVSWFGTDIAERDFLKKELKPMFPPKKDGSVYMVVNEGNGYGLSSIGIGMKKLIKTNYSESVVESYEKLIQGLTEKQPFGRLSLIYGEPGTGKTHLIRALCGDVEKAVFVLFPSSMLSAIDSPSFAALLMRYSESDRPMVIILEDADSCLVKRGADNMSSISSLLNLTDGIFGTLLDLRIVATTNAAAIDIEPALLRPGRIYSTFKVGALTAEEANLAYKEIAGKDFDKNVVFDKDTTLAEVYAKTQKAGTTNPLAKKTKPVGFGVR